MVKNNPTGSTVVIAPVIIMFVLKVTDGSTSLTTQMCDPARG
ncbi:MAG: hypothetical protein K0Q66_1554, partial [Chitinophagaceae bacterium]|nr:hypothetical protein [Chitinophagaceae bacterium]